MVAGRAQPNFFGFKYDDIATLHLDFEPTSLLVRERDGATNLVDGYTGPPRLQSRTLDSPCSGSDNPSFGRKRITCPQKDRRMAVLPVTLQAKERCVVKLVPFKLLSHHGTRTGRWAAGDSGGTIRPSGPMRCPAGSFT